MLRTTILRSAFVLLAAPAITAGAGAQVQQQGAPAAGTLTLANLPAGAREAALASIDARHNIQWMTAYEQSNRALSLDSTFGLARVMRVLTGSGTAGEVNAEYRRGIADALSRGAGEQAYALGLRTGGANGARLLGVARENMPNERRIAMDQALMYGGRVRIDSLRSLARQYPDFVAPRLWLAYYLSFSNYVASPADLYDALAVAQQAVRLAPTLSSSHTILGHALHRLGRNEEAVAHLAAAAKIDPRDEYAYYLQAEIFVRDGKPRSVDRARAALDSAIAVSPNAARRTNQQRERAFLLFYDGRKAEGMAELKSVAKSFETAGVPATAAVVYAQMAGLAAGTGDNADVERYLSEARRVQPNGNVTVQAVQAYALARKPVEARRELNEFIRRSTDTTTAAFISDRHRLTGMTLLAEGKAAEALVELKRSDLAANPFAELAMIDAYTMLGNKSEAAATQAALLASKNTSMAAISTAIAQYRSRKR